MEDSKHKIPRMLMVNDAVPPFISGSSTLTYNLLQGLDTSESFLVSQSEKGFSMVKGSGTDNGVKLEIREHKISGLANFFSRGTSIALPHIAVLFKIPKIVKEAVKVGKEIDAEVVYVNWPSTPFAIAGWLTAKRLKKPLVFYLHDLWFETQKNKVQKLTAKLYEPKIIKDAEKVLVMNPPSGIFITEKYGVKCEVLEHAVNSEIWPLDKKPVRLPANPQQIVMLGAVNKYNKDSVVSFSKAVEFFPNLSLKILTNQTVGDLKAMGLSTAKVSTEFVPRERLQETILEADILYMALGFETNVQKEVEVVIPTRLMDYLPTGIPIIAHGPANTWTLQEAKNRAWGYCINSKEVKVVTQDLDKFLSGESFEPLIEGAWQESIRRDYKNQSKLLADYLHAAVESANN